MGKKTSRFANLAAAAGLVFVAACSDGDPAGPGGGGGDTMSAAEAAVISDFFVNQAFDDLNFGEIGSASSRTDGPSAHLLRVPVDIDYTASAQADCPLSGNVAATVSVEGTIDDETQTGDLDLEVVTTAADCGILADGTGFTIDTNPDLTLTGGFSFAGGQLVGESTFTYAGAILWSAEDGRSGSCTYNVTVAFTATSTAVASGSVCGTSL